MSIKGTHRVRLTTAYGTRSDAGAELSAAVKQMQASNPKLTFSQAMLDVLRHDPQLALRYQQQFREPRAPVKDDAAIKAQQDADHFVTQKVAELQVTNGWTFKRARDAVQLLHPQEWAAYCERNR